MRHFFSKKKTVYLNASEVSAYNNVRNKSDTHIICHAPFKSLLFSPSGQVMACHYNRGYKLGQYPEDNLLDIWNGQQAERLRKSILVNDLSQGCHQCYKDLINKRYTSSGCYKYDNLPEAQPNYPVLMEFQLSNLCNLECVMCSGEYSSGVRINREKMPNYQMPWDDDFVKQLNLFIPHLRKAYFTGGEPFVIPIYRKIWKNVQNLNPSLEMNISTNGSYLDDDIKDILQKGNFHITLSIDSLKPRNYEKIRKNASFETTIKNVDFFQSYALENNRIFSVKCVLFKQNVRDIPDLFAYFNEMGVQVYLKPVWMPFKYSLFNSDADGLADCIKTLESTPLQQDSSIQKQNVTRYNEILAQLSQWHSACLKGGIPDYSDMSLYELKILFSKTTYTEIAYQAVTKKENEDFVSRAAICLKLLEACHLSEENHKKAYRSFLSIPIEFVVFEILRDNDDKLLARFMEEGR